MVFIFALLLSCLGFAIFFRPELISYNIPSSQKKDHEALINSCKAVSILISQCQSLDDLYLLQSRIRTIERPKFLTYNQYTYHLGEVWVCFHNKRISFI